MKDHPWLESTRIQQKGREGGEKPREAQPTSEDDDEQNQVTQKMPYQRIRMREKVECLPRK